MNALQVMDRYQKEVIQVIIQKSDIKFQYLYDNWSLFKQFILLLPLLLISGSFQTFCPKAISIFWLWQGSETRWTNHSQVWNESSQLGYLPSPTGMGLFINYFIKLCPFYKPLAFTIYGMAKKPHIRESKSNTRVSKVKKPKKEEETDIKNLASATHPTPLTLTQI